MPETDAIFDNVHARHDAARADKTCLILSIDTKAKVKIGPFSRDGRSRGASAVCAADHDMGCQTQLVPLGILELSCGQHDIHQLHLTFGQSRETSDFIADGLEQWWSERQSLYPHVRRLQIKLDNGPELRSCRTQFMKRLMDFCDHTGLEVELVYYPPYHSKYNPIERCWGGLELHWNGTLLSTIEVALSWASTMTWRGTQAIIHFIDREYQRGVTIARDKYRTMEHRLERNATLPKWSLVIRPA